MLELDTPHGLARAHLLPVESPVAALVLGHGAGGGIESPDLVGAAEAAGSAGLGVALVEQPYRVAGRRSPAPASRLDAAWTSVVRQLREGPLGGLPDPDRRPLLGRPRRVPHGSRDRLGRRRLPRVPTPPTGPPREEPPTGARRRPRPDARRPGRERPVRDAAGRPEPHRHPHSGHALAEEQRRRCGSRIALADVRSPRRVTTIAGRSTVSRP